MFGFEVYDPKEDDKVSKPKSLDFDSAHSALEKADQKDLFVAADDLLDSMNGYVPFRQARARLPLDPSRPKPSLAIWSFLKSAIGKDLSRVTLPVFFNEPLSMLQRMAEDVEYIELLSLAGRVGYEASLMRLMLVSAFAMSNYSSTPGRINKPFNPMLGETYELVNDEKQYRYISEQVCHHPPISACHCESTDYVFWTEVNVKSKFWGKSLEIHPLGSCHVQLPLYGSNAGDHYSWRKVTTCVNNLIVGKMWIDHFGDLTCRNWRTGEECTLTYKPNTNVDTSGGEIVGVVKDKHGKVRYEIRGNWGSSLGAHVAPGSGSTAIFSRPQIQLWQRTPLPPHAPQFFNFTTLAMMMNELASSNGTSLQRCLPISDSRLRPDQRAMECGQWDDATRWKERLEIAQRERRKNVVARYEREGVADGPQELRWKAQEEIGEEWWIPRWFVREMEPHTGEGHWRFTGEYWKIRNAVVKEAGSWPEWVPDVHDLKTNR
ncbi:Oxysterol-binding protein-domain-containing protein [Cladochytrium replicatum]|nr:Oxysterol-binding protein-domain-containing protein [Cladochytrium replicatum]